LGLPFLDTFGDVTARDYRSDHSTRPLLSLPMSIKRSQSAPQPIQALFSPANARASTLKRPQTNLLRSKSYLVQPPATSSPLATPWVEREDPFSLGGFFPTSPRAAPEEEQWKWLRKEEDEKDAARADKESNSSFSVDDNDSVTGQLEDELAETIKSEDKFGLLSLDTMFSITESDVDDRLFSPYSEEEAIDNDSLYLGHKARRRANSNLHDSKPIESSNLEALFFPSTKDEKEVYGGDSYWPGSIFQDSSVLRSSGLLQV